MLHRSLLPFFTIQDKRTDESPKTHKGQRAWLKIKSLDVSVRCEHALPASYMTFSALTRHFPRLEGSVFDIYRHLLDTEYLVL